MSDLRRATPILCALVALLLVSGATAFERDKPGAFDYYVLVLGWSPSYCISEGRGQQDAQCSTDQAHAFVLHGLWPQYQKGWPEDCYAGRRPWVPRQVIDEMRDIMPGKGLIIHEYRTHGTCSGLSAEDYFRVARELYDKVRVPPRFADPQAQRFLSPESVEREFLAANPWLKPDMIAVTCRRADLLDVRICFDRDLHPERCGVNEDQGRLCHAATIAVPPVR
jgi:ribonuclease T2